MDEIISELKRLYEPTVIPDENRRMARITFEEYMHDAFPHMLAHIEAQARELAAAKVKHYEECAAIAESCSITGGAAAIRIRAAIADGGEVKMNEGICKNCGQTLQYTRGDTYTTETKDYGRGTRCFSHIYCKKCGVKVDCEPARYAVGEK